MPNANLPEAHEHYRAPVMPAEFQPLMQSLLATLACIDFAHEHELERVNSTVVDERLKVKLISKLGQLHREKRQPYTHELLRLDERMRSLMNRLPGGNGDRRRPA